MTNITGTLSVEINGILTSYHFVATPDNTAPVAVDDVATTPEDTWVSSTLNLQDNDLDADGDALSIDPVSVGTFVTTAGGSVTVAADGSYIYTPPADFVGDDTFDYTVTDGSETDVGTLTITVTPVLTEPVTLDPAFDEELQAVGPALSLVAEKITDGSYGLDEYSINDLTIVGGSEEACAAGASYFLREMQGYRWHGPTSPSGDERFIKPRPSSIVRGLVQPKRRDHMLSTDYGMQFGSPVNGTPTSPINSHGVDLHTAWERWKTLNHIGENKYPVGHAQQHVKNDNAQFFADNPDLLMPGVNRFDLDSLPSERMDILTEICAAWVLNGKLNERNNVNFDPPDGNPHDAMTEWTFIHAVGEKVRAGTQAIGQYPAFEGVPDARVGALAYFHHAQPVSFPITPDYASVATAYGQTDLSVDELVQGWGALTDELLMYVYLDLPDWYKCLPGKAYTVKTDYLEENLPKWQAWGVTRNTFEAGANWLWHAVHANQIVNFSKTGDASFQRALDEVMADVYGDDPAVRSLMDVIHDPLKRHDIFVLAELFRHQSDMQEGWYKEFWRQVLYIAYELMFLPPAQDITDPAYDPALDPFPQAFSDMCAHAWNMDADGVYHSYGFISTTGKFVAGQAPYKPYPDLDFARRYKWPEIYGDTYPDFMVNPYPSTQAEFDAAKVVLEAQTFREHAALLDDETDLVFLDNITSPSRPPQNDGATEWHTKTPYGVRFKFVKTDPDATTTVWDADAAYHVNQIKTNPVATTIDGPVWPDPASITDFIVRGGDVLTEFTGGYLFAPIFPPINMGSNLNPFWLYVPQLADQNLIAASQGTMMLLDGSPIYYVQGQEPTSFPVNAGQVMVGKTSSGTMWCMNANIWLSPKAEVALMPRALAEMDGLMGQG